jgi:hypothetical protein
MATIAGIQGNGTAVERTGRQGREVRGTISVSRDDYPLVGDLFGGTEPVEYEGPVECEGTTSTQTRTVFLRRVGTPNSEGIPIYFEQVPSLD